MNIGAITRLRLAYYVSNILTMFLLQEHRNVDLAIMAFIVSSTAYICAVKWVMVKIGEADNWQI